MADDENGADSSDSSVKSRIYRVSTQLFAEKGYHATGIQEISDAAGLGRGALYYHIRSKENLLFEISIRPLRDMLENARATADLDVPTPEKIRLLAAQRVHEIGERRDEWNIALFQSKALSPRTREEVDKTRIAYEAIWERVFVDGAEEGLWDPVDPIALKGILGMLNSTYLWIRPDGRISPDEIGRLYAGLVLDGLIRRA